jgi:AAA15 family ATPase/GTPase
MPKSKIKNKSKIKKIRSTISRTSFSKIILDNFKGYGKNTEIELCEGVNLIYGKNSAGKSSVIQALRLIRQNLLVINTSVPFVPIAPLNLGLAGKIQFPEGIEGVIFAKDKKRILKLGVEIKTNFDNKDDINKRTLVHSFLVPSKNSSTRADFNSIEMKFTKTLKDKLINDTHIKINLGRKKVFNNKSKVAKFLENISNFSGPFSRNELGYKFDNTENSPIDDVYVHENGYIDSLKLSLIKKIFDEINKDFEKNKNKILKYLSAVYLKPKNFNKKKDNLDAYKIIRERDASVVEISRVKKLLNFVKSNNFNNFNKFNDFFVNDILSSAELLRFQDQLLDKKAFEKLIKKEKRKKTKSFFIMPDSYLLNVLDNSLQQRPSFLPAFDFNVNYNNYLGNIRDSLDTVLVIPGLRALPERYHKRGVQTSFVGEQGENIGELIYNREARNRVNKWFKILEIPYEIRSSLKENYFYLELKPIGEKYWISYRDVGLGYSLSLSFILSCLLETQKTILVEEPEVHLHPKLQGDIMDLLLYSSKINKNQFIVETHSENMLLRAQKCIRKGNTELNPDKNKIKVSNKDLGINNIYRENNSSTVQKIKLDTQGEFRTHWRDGFFSERLDDLF